MKFSSVKNGVCDLSRMPILLNVMPPPETSVSWTIKNRQSLKRMIFISSSLHVNKLLLLIVMVINGKGDPTLVLQGTWQPPLEIVLPDSGTAGQDFFST